MTDQQFLWWIHERLVHQYGEDEMMDYMRRLRAVIENARTVASSTNDTKGAEAMRYQFQGNPAPRGEKCP